MKLSIGRNKLMPFFGIFFIVLLVEIAVLVFILTSIWGKDNSLIVKTASDSLGIRNEKSSAVIESNYGYKVLINRNLYDFFGTTVKSDQTFVDYTGNDVLIPNDYAILTIYPKVSLNSGYSSMTISSSIIKNFFEKKREQFGSNLTDTEAAFENFNPSNNDDNETKYNQFSKSNVKIGIVEYQRYDFERIPTNKILNSVLGIKKVTLLVTVQNGRPYAIRLDYDSQASYDNLIRIVENISYQSPSQDAYYAIGNLDQKLNRHAPTSKAVAGISDSQSSVTTGGNVRNVASNLPAVVRIAAIYCYSVSLEDGNRQFSVKIDYPLCAGGYGSGFFISSDGYIGTNGHVALLSSRDAMVSAILVNNEDFMSKFLQFYYRYTEGISLSDDLAKQAAAIIYSSKDSTLQTISLILSMPEELIKATEKLNGYAVQLGSDPVDFIYDQATDTTRLKYSGTIVEATLVAIDYSPEDLITGNLSDTGFTKSDVAILKIDANNVPVVKIGSADELVQGETITIIGFPGKSENELVDQVESKATATSGIISSIRKAAGNNNKLIQSDVSIDHGNSGGPAFNSSGEVIGIATYGLLDGGGTFNYMRDVNDLVNLAKSKNIQLVSESTTQKYWDDGLDKFFNRYFSKAINDFQFVKDIYLPHVLAPEYIEISKSKIANGEEAFDPSVLIVFAAVGLVLLIVSGGVIIFIVVARRNHLSDKVDIPKPPESQMQIPTPPNIPKPPIS